MDSKTKKVIKNVCTILILISEAVICLLGGYTRSNQVFQHQIEEAQSQRDFFYNANTELNQRIYMLQKEVEALEAQNSSLSKEQGDVSIDELTEENSLLKADNENLREQVESLLTIIGRISDMDWHLVTLSETSYDGRVTISSRYATEGEEILVKLEPANGFRVICSDSIGNTIMSKWEDGTWRFIMPPNDVTVEIIVQS